MGCQGTGLGNDLGRGLSGSGVNDQVPNTAWPPCLTHTLNIFFQQGWSNEQAAVITSEQ